MVSAEKGETSELAGRLGSNAKRPAKANSPSFPFDGEEREGGARMRVGRDYQATLPPMIPVEEWKLDQYADKALLVWSPTEKLTEAQLEHYIVHAKEKFGYNAEQALGMLFWHKHDMDKAIHDLSNFTPFPDEWSVDEKVLFEQAFQFYGKSFHRIRQMLPDKSIAALVRYYYSWKKTRTKTNTMDRQVRRIVAQKGEEAAAVDSTNNKVSLLKTSQKMKAETKNVCNACGATLPLSQGVANGNSCTTCLAVNQKTDSTPRENKPALSSTGKLAKKEPQSSSELQTTKPDPQSNAFIKAINTKFNSLKRVKDEPVTKVTSSSDRVFPAAKRQRASKTNVKT